MQSRRQFIQNSMTIGAGFLLSNFFPGFSRFVQAAANAEKKDHFFVLMTVHDGMDATLGLDPQVLPSDADEKDMFVEYRPEDIVQAEGLRLGPSAVALKEFAADCAIVNGVMMRRDAGHDVCARYMLSGDVNRKAGLVPVEIYANYSSGPFGILTDGAQVDNGSRPVILMGTQSLQQAVSGNSTGNPIEALSPVLLEGDVASFGLLEQAQYAFLNSQKEFEKAKEAVKAFQANGVTELTKEYLVAAAFVCGGAQQAVVNMNGSNSSMDTHSQHAGNHLVAQKLVWDGVAKFFKIFKSVPYKDGSLFDYTTFFVGGEFSRTPALNAAKGKDHNVNTNSVLLAGRGVSGGQVFGASRLIPRKRLQDKLRKKLLNGAMELTKEQKEQIELEQSIHIASPFDYQLGAPVTRTQGASFIFPENVIQAIAKIHGSPNGFAFLDKSVPAVPKLAKE